MTSESTKQKKKWTEEEIDFLTKNKDVLSLSELAEALNRTKSSVKHKTNQLGITFDKVGVWEQKEIDYILENIEVLKVSELAKKLNRTEKSVRSKISQLGLSVNKTKPWSQEDLDYLEVNWGVLSVDVLSEKLNRTPIAIKSKAQTMGIRTDASWSQLDIDYLIEHWGKSEFYNLRTRLRRPMSAIKCKAYELNLGPAVSAMGDLFSVYQVSQFLGVKRDTIRKWGKLYGFPLQLRRLTKRAVYMVDCDDLIDWLENNQDKWDASKMERYTLNVEPEWLTEKIKHDKKSPHKSRYRKWKPEEDSKLKYFYLQGLSYKEISLKLDNRTEGAVIQRLNKLSVYSTSKNKLLDKVFADSL